MAVVVRGYSGLMRAFAQAERDVKLGLRHGLRDVAQPIAGTAEELARSRITNIGDQWPRMRVGVTQKVVYVAPRQRNKGGSKRRNLAGLLD